MEQGLPLKVAEAVYHSGDIEKARKKCKLSQKQMSDMLETREYKDMFYMILDRNEVPIREAVVNRLYSMAFRTDIGEFKGFLDGKETFEELQARKIDTRSITSMKPLKYGGYEIRVINPLKAMELLVKILPPARRLEGGEDKVLASLDRFGVGEVIDVEP
jgi:hypothetical protein